MWLIDITGEGQIELTAPNGELLFVVNPDTAETIAHMLLDTVEQIRQWDEEDAYDYGWNSQGHWQ